MVVLIVSCRSNNVVLSSLFHGQSSSSGFRCEFLEWITPQLGQRSKVLIGLHKYDGTMERLHGGCCKNMCISVCVCVSPCICYLLWTKILVLL